MTTTQTPNPNHPNPHPQPHPQPQTLLLHPPHTVPNHPNTDPSLPQNPLLIPISNQHYLLCSQERNILDQLEYFQYFRVIGKEGQVVREYVQKEFYVGFDVVAEGVLYVYGYRDGVQGRGKVMKLVKWDMETDQRVELTLQSQFRNAFPFIFPQSQLFCLCLQKPDYKPQKTHPQPHLPQTFTTTFQIFYYHYPSTLQNKSLHHHKFTVNSTGLEFTIKKLNQKSMIGIFEKDVEEGEGVGGEVGMVNFVRFWAYQAGKGCREYKFPFRIQVWLVNDIWEVKQGYFFVSVLLKSIQGLPDSSETSYNHYIICTIKGSKFVRRLDFSPTQPHHIQFTNSFRNLPNPSTPIYYLDPQTFTILSKQHPSSPNITITVPSYNKNLQFWTTINYNTYELTIQQKELTQFRFGSRVVTAFLLCEDQAHEKLDQDLVGYVIDMCNDRYFI